MNSELATSTPAERGLDPNTLKDVLSLLSQIGPREALSFKASDSDKDYVLQLMPVGAERCVVTVFEEGATSLSFQFAINVNDGQYLYGDDIGKNTPLLQNLLANVKSQSAPTKELPTISSPLVERIAKSLAWVPGFIEDLATFPSSGHTPLKENRPPADENPYA